MPAFKATIKFSGDVAIRLADKIPLSYVTNKGLEVTFKHQSNSVMERLLAGTHIEWDKKSNRIKYECNMVSHSINSNGPSTSIGISVSSNKPVPILKGEFHFPELKGYLGSDFYFATNVKVVIEIEPKAPKLVRRPNTDMVNDLQYTRQTSPNTVPPNVNWQLVGTGFALLTATIIADFLTGVSVADDFVTIPIALRTIASGFIIYSMVPTNAVAGQQFPCAKSH